MRAPSCIRFLLAIFFGILFSWALLAVWVMAVPLSILNEGQVPLIAKDELLRRCPRSDIVVFGDSRAEAAIDPRLINLTTVNFARGFGSLAEDYYRVGRYLACGNKPRLLIFSDDLAGYVRVNPVSFWQGTAITQVLPFRERNEIIDRISGPGSAFLALSPGEVGPYPNVPAKLKNFLYAVYFPFLWSSNVMGSLQHGIMFRYNDNVRIWNEIFANHGRFEYHIVPHVPGPAFDVELRVTRPSPAIDYYLSAMLTMLRDENIPTLVMVMPVNDSTYAGIAAPVREGLMRYLNELPAMFPNVIIADTDLPRWPERYIGDTTLHLNDAGAAAVAATLNHCIPAILSGAAANSCGLAVPAL